MFSKTIFKQTLKSNWKLWLIFTIIPSVISSAIIAVYDPHAFGDMQNVVSEIPGIGDFVSGIIDSMSLLGMLGNSFYFLPGILLPTIYIIITANSLVASQVDRGSMAYTLSTPIKRIKVICTQAIYLILSVFCMFLLITAIGLFAAQGAHNVLWGDADFSFDIGAYILLNIGAFLLMFAISSISFMFSCIFNLTKNSLALGAGFPVAFFIFEIMAQTSDDFEFFKYISLNSLFMPAEITGGGTFLPQFAAMSVLGVILYAIGIKVFKEKDLPL